MRWWLALGGVAALVWCAAELERPLANPHPRKSRRKWASYANTVATEPRPRRLTQMGWEPVTAPPRLDEDSPVSDLLDWIAWSDGVARGDPKWLDQYYDIDDRSDPDLADDLWATIGERAEADEF